MDKPAALGIDVGGTKTLCVLVDKHCRTVADAKFKTEPQKGRSGFTRELTKAVQTLQKIARTKGFRVVGAGIGFAGVVDEKEVRIKTSPNLQALEDYSIGKSLKKLVRGEITIGNDVQLGVYAEHKLGVAKGCSNVLGAFFGTGVGGGVILNNKLYHGTSGLGGQVGSLLVQAMGGPEAALSHGIVDRIASKGSIASEALVMAVKKWAPYLHRKVDTDISKITWGTLHRAIQAGDEKIEEMLRARMRVVGIALSNVINFLNPDILVLGGGLVTEMPKLVIGEIEGGLREYLVPQVNKVLKVKPVRLGHEAVALGAAYQALERAEV